MTVLPGKLLTIMLAAASVILVGVLGIQLATFSFDAESLESIAQTQLSEAPIAQDIAPFPPAAHYRQVGMRPVFNERRRVWTEIKDGPPSGKSPIDAEPPELMVAVTGTVITPTTRIVLVRSNKTQETIALKAGMVLGDEQHRWRVDQIDERKASFEGPAGEVTEIDMLIHDRVLAAGI